MTMTTCGGSASMVDEDDPAGTRAGAPLAARQRGDRRRLEVSRGSMHWDVDECAAVLAFMVPEGTRRFGRKTIHRTLAQAAQRNVTARNAARHADAHLVDYYRQELVKHEFFSPADVAAAARRRDQSETST